MLFRDAVNPDYLPTGHQMAGPSSHMSTQSANGPNTFDEALRYLEFSVAERHKIAGELFYGSSNNSPAAQLVLPHPSHLSPQGYPAETLYHYHGQYAPPNQAIPATHQGTGIVALLDCYSHIIKLPSTTLCTIHTLPTSSSSSAPRPSAPSHPWSSLFFAFSSSPPLYRRDPISLDSTSDPSYELAS